MNKRGGSRTVGGEPERVWEAGAEEEEKNPGKVLKKVEESKTKNYDRKELNAFERERRGATMAFLEGRGVQA